MKRRLATALAALCLILSGCGTGSASQDKLRIVATIMPEYDWVMNVLGENPGNAEVTLLLESGADLHSYQPSAADIMKIADCDVFICVGGESDKWTEDALKESRNPDLTVIRLLETDGAGVKEEETPEGAEEEHDHEHEHEEEYDEHIWLSLRSAQVLVQKISDVIAEKDPDHADVYNANTQAYLEQLAALDQQYQETAANAKFSSLLFGDRYPFRYMADDYGLTCYAAFSGCSAETEASFETVLFLAGKLDELGLNHVMTIEGSDGRIAKTIIENSKDKNRNILTLNSMQGSMNKHTSYLDVMNDNLNVLKEALN
ncbi:MAG: zinc ABC transporter substrate-binding protein [Solobacterium sp.]|nr:zinc ABC transporter substrate-binding protein [Solobacterium sp.]